MDKYGVGQDAYCYPGTTVLRNRLNIQDDDQLFQVERDFSELAASQIEFQLPPYDLAYLQGVHRTLLMDVYAWGENAKQSAHPIHKGARANCRPAERARLAATYAFA